MKLTGNAKKDFEKWFNKAYNTNHVWCNYKLFTLKPLPMQFGVVVDWADSVEVYIEIIIVDKCSYGIQIFKLESATPVYSVSSWETRQEARDKAIERLNEMYNEISSKG